MNPAQSFLNSPCHFEVFLGHQWLGLVLTVGWLCYNGTLTSWGLGQHVSTFSYMNKWEIVKMSRWGGGVQIKRARQVDWEQKRQERASTRQNGCLPVVEKSGREANIRTTEWAAVWFNFTLFISSPPPVTANRAILFQVCCNPTPAKHSHPMH